MNEKIYKITLSDGTVIENLTLNGDNFVSKVDIDSAVFEGNCSPVIIESDDCVDIHNNMELIQVTHVGTEVWIALRDLSEEEMAKIKMQSDIEYIAMMTGVEL